VADQVTPDETPRDATSPSPSPGSASAAVPPPGSHTTPFSGVTGLRFRGVPLLTLVLLGFALAVVVGNYLPTRARTAATARQLDAQRRENRESAERIRRAEAEAIQLEKDPWMTERILRDELHMTRKGEVIIR
jgi:cell division protein FtsB